MMDTDDSSQPKTRSISDIVGLLKQIDYRVRMLELHAVERQHPPPRAAEDGEKRPRGRPFGSRNRAKVELHRSMFEENQLDHTEMMARSALEAWIVRSKTKHAPWLCRVVLDDDAWQPAATTHRRRVDYATRCWLSLTQVRNYCVVACKEPEAFAQAVALCEHVPVTDMKLARRGLQLIAEYIAILPARLPARFVPAAA
jgi:hypothetical protein